MLLIHLSLISGYFLLAVSASSYSTSGSSETDIKTREYAPLPIAPPPSRETSPRSNASPLSATHPPMSSRKRHDSSSDDASEYSPISSSKKLTRVAGKKGFVYLLSKGSSERMRSSNDSSSDTPGSNSDAELSKSQPGSGKRSLRVSGSTQNSPQVLAKKLYQASLPFDPNDYGWTFSGKGIDKKLVMTANQIPSGYILAFNLHHHKYQPETVRTSFDSPSATSSTNESETEEESQNEAHRVHHIKYGYITGRSLELDVKEIELLFRTCENDRVVVSCYLFRTHDGDMSTYIGSRTLMRVAGEDRWQMLEAPIGSAVEVKDVGYGFQIDLTKPLTEKQDLVLMQRLSCGHLQVGRTEKSSIIVYRRPLESKYDHDFTGSFKVILTRKEVENPDEVLLNLDTRFAKTLHVMPLPHGERLCSLPVYFITDHSWTNESITMKCVDPQFTEFVVIFLERVPIESEDSDIRYQLNPVDSIMVKDSQLKIPLYPRKADCYHKRYVVRVFEKPADDDEFEICIGMTNIPTNRTWSQQVDYEPITVPSDDDSTTDEDTEGDCNDDDEGNDQEFSTHFVF